MKKDIILSEDQLKKLIYKIIKEVRGGYDDYDVMATHAESSMKTMIHSLSDLTASLLNMIQSVAFLDDPIGSEGFFESANEFISLVDDYKDVNKIVYRDFSEDEVINAGRRLLKKLNTLQENLRRIQTFGREFFQSNDDFKEKFKNYAIDVFQSIQDYDQTLEKTHNMFAGRLSGKGRQKNEES